MSSDSTIDKYSNAYMNVAKEFSFLSYAVRKKVGCVIVKEGNIIAHGWNGTPSGVDNCCEYEENGELITKQEVLHAELNALMKLAKGTQSSEGSSLYVTLSPCLHCAKLIVQAGVTSVYYSEEYRDLEGVKFLLNLGVSIYKETNGSFQKLKRV